MNQPIPSVMQVMDPHSQTAGGTQQLREAFIRKNRKKFGVLPNWGPPPPPLAKPEKFGKFPAFSGTFLVVF